MPDFPRSLIEFQQRFPDEAAEDEDELLRDYIEGVG